jgi:hypothetical protein
MTATVTERATGRSLITPDLFERLVRRIESEEKLGHAFAARIVDQALAFLAACATNTGVPLAPSQLVDIGWHVFLLHTRDYAAFCERVAQRFLHHVPTDADDPSANSEAARGAVARAMVAIEAAGFTVDADLWSDTARSDCTGCHNGCHDDPPPSHQ